MNIPGVDKAEACQLALLQAALQVSVPLWIDRLRVEPWEYIQERARICADHVAAHGDVILYRGKKKGASAEAFNRLAEGIACLAFAPGGVRLSMLGLHFQARR